MKLTVGTLAKESGINLETIRKSWNFFPYESILTPNVLM